MRIQVIDGHPDAGSERVVAIHGVARKGFEAVRQAFAENFSRRHELGAACCIYQRGEKVVDLWGGIRNRATGEAWEENTWSWCSRQPRASRPWPWRWPIRAAGSTTRSGCARIGRSSPRRARTK